jgi:SpoIID/LytB domain protein
MTFTILPISAQHIAPIPEATMRAAREGGFSFEEPMVVEIAKPPNSETIRAAIGDNALKNYTYSEISVFGTAEINVYEGGRLVGKFPANKSVKIKLADGQIKFYENEHVLPQVLSGVVEIDCPDGLLGVEGLKRAGKQALYHGSFEIAKVNGSGKFNLINKIEVEEYLKGVVPNEMPVAFGLEALKAQSVAARNYVLSPRAKSSVNYDVVDSVASQVYFGANTERPLATQAVKETEGVLALYNGEPILALYSSTAGGYTESYANAFLQAQRPYLVGKPDILSQTPLNTDEAALEYYKSKPDAYDIRSPYFRWEREWGANELKEILRSTTDGAEIKELKVKKRGESGKIVDLEIVTVNGNFTVSKELVIRRLLTKNGTTLPSANIAFEHEYDDNCKLVKVKAYGGGYGHGVGLSQYGAGFMGTELKLPYKKILQHYYTGISLGTKHVIISSDVPSATINFYNPGSEARIILENKISKLIVNINGKEYLLPTGGLFGKKATELDISEYVKPGRNTLTFRYPPDESSKKTVELYVELEKKIDADIWQ